MEGATQPAVRRDTMPGMGLELTRRGVVVPSRVDPRGIDGPTPGQARGPRWRAVARGLYVPAETDAVGAQQRIVQAVVGCGEDAAATGWAALAWRGARWFPGVERDGSSPSPVPVALGDRRVARPRAGVTISEDWLFPGDVDEIDGLRVTSAERAVCYEVRRARSLLRAVQVIDMAAFDDLVEVTTLAAYAERLGARPGTRRLRAALAWAEENVWSVQEVGMRLEWLTARPSAVLRCNAPLFDHRGRHLVTPDLIDPVAGVVGEYDGLLHLEDGQRRRDLDREEIYRELGLEAVTMMSGDLADRRRFLSRLDGAYRRALSSAGASAGSSAGASAGTRSWTLEHPDWWVDTSTVGRRRALDDRQRAIWLRYRTAGRDRARIART